MCRHKTIDKILALILAVVVLSGAGFILYSTQATCESVLAPAHRACTD